MVACERERAKLCVGVASDGTAVGDADAKSVRACAAPAPLLVRPHQVLCPFGASSLSPSARDQQTSDSIASRADTHHSLSPTLLTRARRSTMT